MPVSKRLPSANARCSFSDLASAFLALLPRSSPSQLVKRALAVGYTLVL